MTKLLSIRRYLKIGIYTLIFVIAILSILIYISYRKDMNAAYKSLKSYDVKTFHTQYGEMSYVDNGIGEAILISHGIFGGYDQGYISLNTLVKDDYRKISISRFGYPGSDLPSNPTPQNQAVAFKELLDQLEKIKCPVLVIHAKDNPMAPYENIEKLLKRINAQTAIFETGGHMIEGHDSYTKIKEFINSTK